MSTPSQPAGGVIRRFILGQDQGTPIRRPVLVTPLSIQQENVPPRAKQLIKVLIKVVPQDDPKGKTQKVFTLRNVDTETVHSCDDIREIIKAQLEGEIVSDRKFDVGIVSGATSVISLRTKDDLNDFWGDVRLGKKVMLWCNGLKTSANKKAKSKKRKPADDDFEVILQSDESDQDDFPLLVQPKRNKRRNTAKEEREGRVQDTIQTIKDKHSGGNFTPMQIRIWAEMIVSELHSSLENPPTSTMFVRAGDGNSSKKKSDSNPTLTEAVTQATTVLSAALTSPRPAAASNLPASQIEARSMCYKQHGELKILRDTEVLSEEEYSTEKQAVMQVLNSLTPTSTPTRAQT